MSERKRIMVVEDEAIVSMDIQDSLTHLGYEVVAAATSGEEAIELAGEHRPEMILMDIMLMGDMNGIEAAKVIRERFSIPIIYLTAYSSNDMLDSAMVTGPYSYLIKPFNKEELNSAIKIGLYKHRMDMAVVRAHGELEIAYNELRSLDGLKQRIIDSVSHELKTPLSISLMSLEFAMTENRNDEVERYLRMAKGAMDRQSRIVENLIVESWTYREGLDLNMEKISLEDMIQIVIGELRDEIKKKEVKVETNLAEIHIFVDFKKTKQALLNIIDNAVKFMEKGGVISISAWCKNGCVEMIVEDTGIGIEERYHDRIFENLFQIEQDSTRRFPGIGMGLSIAKTIVESHGGEIWVESEVGTGSMFHITLPREGEGSSS